MKKNRNLIPKNWDYKIRNVEDLDYIEQLHTPSVEVDVKSEIKYGGMLECIAKLKKFVRNDNVVQGIAAPQVGINKRLFVINCNGKCTTYINPIINKVYEPRFAVQSCSSCDKEYMCIRYNVIDVFYQMPTNDAKCVSVKLSGKIAVEFQKLYDILCGIYIADKDNLTLEYNDDMKLLTDEQKQQIIEDLRNRGSKNE
jgi:peptide deformylase